MQSPSRRSWLGSIVSIGAAATSMFSLGATVPWTEKLQSECVVCCLKNDCCVCSWDWFVSRRHRQAELESVTLVF